MASSSNWQDSEGLSVEDGIVVASPVVAELPTRPSRKRKTRSPRTNNDTPTERQLSEPVPNEWDLLVLVMMLASWFVDVRKGCRAVSATYLQSKYCQVAPPA